MLETNFLLFSLILFICTFSTFPVIETKMISMVNKFCVLEILLSILKAFRIFRFLSLSSDCSLQTVWVGIWVSCYLYLCCIQDILHFLAVLCLMYSLLRHVLHTILDIQVRAFAIPYSANWHVRQKLVQMFRFWYYLDWT